MKKIGVILLGLLVWWACSDEDHKLKTDIPGISPVESFTDIRDGQIYPCIQIGGQIWMAVNLNYYLPKGALDGSFTWKEPLFDESEVVISEEKFQVKIYQAIEAGEIKTVTVHYPFGDFEMGPADDIKEWLQHGRSSDKIIEELEAWLQNMAPYYAEDMVNAYEEALDVVRKIVSDLTEEVILEYARLHFERYDSESSGYSSTYGMLYSYEGALAAVPEGWRLPTDEDWKKLEKYLGMSANEVNGLNRWRGQDIGNLLKAGEEGIGFNALYAGCNAYTPENSIHYVRLDEGAYFWSSTLLVETDSTDLGIIRNVALYDRGIMRTTTKLKGYKPVLYSVRCIKNEE